MSITTVFDDFPCVSFCLGIAAIIFLYWYSIRDHDYWKQKGIPFVKPLPFVGTSLDVFKKPTHELELERYQTYGRIYGHFEGNTPVLSVGDPATLRNILVKDFNIFPGTRFSSTGNSIQDSMLSFSKGETWKRLRTIVSPTFSTGKMKRMMSILNSCAETLMKNIKKAVEKNEPIDAKSVFGAFTMDVIAIAAFSTKLDSLQDPNNKFVKMAKGLLPTRLNIKMLTLMLAPRLMKLLGQSFLSLEGLNFFSEVTHQIIDERKKTGQTRNDFLQLLLDTSKEFEEECEKNQQPVDEADDITSNYGAKEDTQHLYRSPFSKKSLSTDEMLAQCIIFFLAGYEPTSTTLAFAAYLMALHPDVQEKVHAEVKTVLKDTDGLVTYEAVQKMKYLDNVISETLRLYSPATRSERMSEADYRLGETGITIPKGTVITIPIYALHRDPEFFPNPDKFDPDRFSQRGRSEQEVFSYIPFGAGPRNCIAMRFALLEIKVCLAHLIHRFEIKTCEQTKVPLEFRCGTPMLQPIGIILQLKLRNASL